MITRTHLARQLRDLGLKPSDLVMLHVSLRSVGDVLGGPDQVHQAILDAVSPGGTMMMYVGCDREYEAVGRVGMTPQDEETVMRNMPAFDPDRARARRDYGALAEIFRSWPGTVCSRNPGARIAALGGKSRWLTADHPLSYGYGPGSPLAKLYDHKGKLLLLGSDLDQVTLLHFAEHIAPIENKRVKQFKVHLKTETGSEWVEIEDYDTSVGVRVWPPQFFSTIMHEYLTAMNIKPAKVGSANCYLLDAHSLVSFAVEKFVKTAK